MTSGICLISANTLCYPRRRPWPLAWSRWITQERRSLPLLLKRCRVLRVFQAYFLAFFAYKEYTQIVDRFFKMGKSVNSDPTQWPFRNGKFLPISIEKRTQTLNTLGQDLLFSSWDSSGDEREKSSYLCLFFLEKFFFMAVPLEMLVCLLFGIRKLLWRVTSTVALLPGKVFPTLNRT